MTPAETKLGEILAGQLQLFYGGRYTPKTRRIEGPISVIVRAPNGSEYLVTVPLPTSVPRSPPRKMPKFYASLYHPPRLGYHNLAEVFYSTALQAAADQGNQPAPPAPARV